MEHGLGSGVIISPDGYIVTNNHVIDGAVDIRVTMSNREVLSAKLIGADPLTDLAVIKVNGTNLPSVPWGNSADLHPGQTVLAFGNPYGFRFTVTRGIISALNRPNPDASDRRKPGEFIQTDAAINPGNSGGALVERARRTHRNQHLPDFVTRIVLRNGLCDSDADRPAHGGDLDSRRQSHSRIYRNSDLRRNSRQRQVLPDEQS